ncbi:MAG: hypothetical protein H6509_11215 [Bryobacterales bacterium]|nr:hypothetical protein [Bryobacterales bacterium]
MFVPLAFAAAQPTAIGLYPACPAYGSLVGSSPSRPSDRLRAVGVMLDPLAKSRML